MIEETRKELAEFLAEKRISQRQAADESGLLSLGDFTFSDRLVKKCSVCRLA